VRLVDAVFRQGHLSDQALAEAVMTGERPVHLDRCDLCASRAVDLGRWLDDARAVAQEAADQVFTAERLAAQHGQILRKLEQVDAPPRVIAFPGQSRFSSPEGGGRRVAPAWVGIAAAAGLVIGVVGGQMSARMTMPQPVATPASSEVGIPLEPTTGDALDTLPVSASWDLDDLAVPETLKPYHEMTPQMVTRTSLNITR
jgi:hypothetical protein